MNESLKYKLYKSENNFPELIKMIIYSLVLGTLLLTKIQESIVLAQKHRIESSEWHRIQNYFKPI